MTTAMRMYMSRIEFCRLRIWDSRVSRQVRLQVSFPGAVTFPQTLQCRWSSARLTGEREAAGGLAYALTPRAAGRGRSRPRAAGRNRPRPGGRR